MDWESNFSCFLGSKIIKNLSEHKDSADSELRLLVLDQIHIWFHVIVKLEAQLFVDSYHICLFFFKYINGQRTTVPSLQIPAQTSFC